jgi:lipopolysaccharide export system protein LptA
MRLAIFAGALFIGSAFAAGAQTEQSQPTQTKSTAAHPAQGGFAFSSRKCHGPIDVSSDSFEGDMQTKVGTYIGNVIMIQAECKLRADKVIAEATKGNDLDRMTAIGNVVFTSTSGTAVGDHGVYDLGDKKTITLTGKVVLTKGKDVMRGTRLIVDMDTGLAHMTAKGMPGGRVQSSFIPKHQNDEPAKPKPSGDN